MIAKFPWKVFLRARRLQPQWADIERFEAADGEVARRAIGARVLAQLKYFGAREDALPEWRDAAQAGSVDEMWAVWPSLPILTRRELTTRFSPEEIRGLLQVRGSISATGGSTGEPVRYLHDRRMLQATTALRLYSRMRMGWTPGMAQVCLWGSDRDIGKAQEPLRRLSAAFRNEWLVAGFRVDGKTVDRATALILAHNGVAVYGFTSLLEYLARTVLERGLGTPIGRVRCAWNGGEMLFPHQVEVFRRAFGVPILNFYGCRELSALACQRAEDAPLDVLRPQVFLEIVDEAGRQVAPGQVGRLVWTSTVCRGTPFLRYDVGDLGTYTSDGADESGVRRIAELHGRSARLVNLGGGEKLSALFFYHLLKEYPEIEQFQIVIRASATIELRCVGQVLRHERRSSLIRSMRRAAPSHRFEIRMVEEIPRTPQGKLVQVVEEP